MPFPYELYPKAKETHCLNLPEISVSRPPFPGSIRTADGCFWGERDNNSYVSTHKTDKVCTADGKCYNYNDVFVDEVDPGHSNTCGQTCYVACSCNTSNGWYSTCQGSDCFSVTDTRYAGQPNAASASRSLSDIGSISASAAGNYTATAASAANSGLKTASAAGNYTATAASAGLKTASVAAKSGISTMASGATICYKKKTCSEGGYESSEPDGKKCTQFDYNGYTCYKDCKDEIKYYSVTINKVFDSSCPTNFAAGFNGISSCNVGSVNCSTYENSITVSNVAEGTSYSWTPTDSYSTTETTATYSGGTKSGTVNSNLTLTATYTCSSGSTQEPKCTCWPNCWYYVTTYGRNKYIVCNIECTYNGGPTMEICVDIDNSLGNTMCGGVGFITYKYVGPVTDNITSSGLGESISIYDWSPKTDNCMPNANIGGGGVGPIGYPDDLN